MKELAITLPGYNITAPGGIPDSGLGGAGKTFITGIIGILLLIAALLALFYLVWGGFKWMTSGGDKEKLFAARQTIIYAIIGLVVSLLAFAIMNAISAFLGVNLLGTF